MFVGNLPQLIVIPVATHSYSTQNQYPPQAHSLATLVGINIRGYQTAQDLPDRRSQFRITVDCLEPNEQLTDFVSRLEIEVDVRDGDLTHLHLPLDDVAHDFPPKICLHRTSML